MSSIKLFHVIEVYSASNVGGMVSVIRSIAAGY